MPIIPQTFAVLGGKNIDHGHPKYIEEVAEDFPDLTIICGHACNPYDREMIIREMIIVTARRGYISASPDSLLYDSTMGSLPVGKMDWVWAINNNYFGIADRVLFGSSYLFMPIKLYVESFF